MTSKRRICLNNLLRKQKNSLEKISNTSFSSIFINITHSLKNPYVSSVQTSKFLSLKTTGVVETEKTTIFFYKQSCGFYSLAVLFSGGYYKKYDRGLFQKYWGAGRSHYSQKIPSHFPPLPIFSSTVLNTEIILLCKLLF